MADEGKEFVTRAGYKLDFALDYFAIDVHGRLACDLGSHIGGFVDCLLKRGARKVYSVDTSYGTLDWKLRNDPRVVVMERTNALHVKLPEPVDVVTIDVGWTPQRLILPVAAKLCAQGGVVVSLVKPQYEAPKELVEKGVLKEKHHTALLDEMSALLATMRIDVAGVAKSPIPGGKGNIEYFFLIRK